MNGNIVLSVMDVVGIKIQHQLLSHVGVPAFHVDDLTILTKSGEEIQIKLFSSTSSTFGAAIGAALENLNGPSPEKAGAS